MSTAIIILLTVLLLPSLLIHCTASTKRRKSIRRVRQIGARVHRRGVAVEAPREYTAPDGEEAPQVVEQKPKVPKSSEYVLLPEQTPRDTSHKSNKNRSFSLIKKLNKLRKSEKSKSPRQRKVIPIVPAREKELKDMKEHKSTVNTAEEKTGGKPATSHPKTPAKTVSSPSSVADTPKRDPQYMASQRDDDTLRCVKSIHN